MKLGLEKDVVAYGALLTSLSHGLWSDALHVLGGMAASGAVNEVSVNCVLSSVGQEKQWPRALGMLQGMGTRASDVPFLRESAVSRGS